MSEWVRTDERLPELDPRERYAQSSVSVLVWLDISLIPLPARWASNRFAKTEKGRAWRFENPFGSPMQMPTHWMYMPEGPKP